MSDRPTVATSPTVAKRPKSPRRLTVAIAGAAGVVGTGLREALRADYDILALTQSAVRARRHAASAPGETWRHCDLFDPYAVRDGLAGADYAIYLVHSMLPSARLTQGRVADYDLLQADNFARAAEVQGVKQILYLGALVPEDEPDLPASLRHRLEVEQALASTSVPLTTLRAGLIVGPGGTWLRLLLTLVRRLPVMVLPSWTRAQTQPIALRDVIRALRRCIGRPATCGATYDVGGPETMSYREMLLRTADVLGLQRRTATVPVESPRLSKLWVRLFGGAPWALVSPIVDSLRYQSRVRPNDVQDWLVRDARSFEEALAASVDKRGRPLPNPRDALRPREEAALRTQSTVRSVQRLPCPPGCTARDVANEYLEWLPRIGRPLVRVRVETGRVAHFDLWPTGHTLLTLRFAADRSPTGRQLFHVVGGVLAREAEGSGRLEFRQVLEGRFVLAALHDFAPRLPWSVYKATQALVHRLVMRRFRRHLEGLSHRQPPSSSAASSP